jgi:hypothetical protein
MIGIVQLLLVESFLLLGLLTGCQTNMSSYGFSEVSLPNGQKLFFRREARGLNYDSLSITANPDFCASPNLDEDITFPSIGAVVFHRFNEGRLVIYVISPPQIPKESPLKDVVTIQKITNPEFLNLKETYKERGLELADVPLDESLKCAR